MDSNNKPMNEEYFAAEVNGPAQESRYAWLRGFRDIFFSPVRVGYLTVANPLRPIVVAVLLWSLAVIASDAIRSSSPALVHQNNVMEENDQRAIGRYARIDEAKIEKQLEDLRQRRNNNSFNLPSKLAWGVVYGFVSIAVLGVVYWIFVRMFNSEPPSFASILAIVSYGNAITAVGLLVVAGCQYASGSLFVSPSLAFLAGPPERASTLVHTLLLKLNVFTLWEYAVVGIAVAASANMPRKWGIVFGSVAFLCIYGVFSVLIFLYALRA